LESLAVPYPYAGRARRNEFNKFTALKERDVRYCFEIANRMDEMNEESL
jgi:hypothetical protein